LIKILITDDHPIILDGIAHLISSYPQFEIVGKALNGIEALDILKDRDVDIILLDLAMPAMDGIKTSRQIQNFHPKVKVIVYTGYEDTKLVKDLSKYNIMGYLYKSSPSENLALAIETVYGGNKYFDKNIDPGVLKETKISVQSQSLPKFSKRETQVLKLICNGYKNREMSEKLELKVNTIETYRARIMAKSKMKNVVTLVKWAIKSGLVN